MKVIILVDSEVIGYPSDQQVFVDSEMGDTVEDIKVKITLSFASVDPKNIDLFYQNRKWDNSTDFNHMNYEPETVIYCRAKSKACGCLIF